MILRALSFPLLYTLAFAPANIAAAQVLDEAARAEVGALREGDMRGLAIHDAPLPGSPVPFLDHGGEETTLAESNGKLRIVNFWATWCAPCRKEMPELDALQAELGGDDFEVMLVATGRNEPEAIARFFDEAGINSLETATDPRSKLAQDMVVPGLPVTVILNRDGDEIARLMGAADWNSDSARAIVSELIAR